MCPSTTAAWVRTSSRSRASCSAAVSPASRSESWRPSSAAPPALACCRPERTRPRSRFGTPRPAAASARTARRSSLTGTSSACSDTRPASKSSMPSAADIASTPLRLARAWSTVLRCVAMPRVWSHRPQASDRPGRPAARRLFISPSRKAFAAE